MAKKIEFPKDFVWGAATASYQIEGAWDKHGKGESIWDRFSHTPGKVDNGDTGDVANDHYNLWRKDIRLMKQLGLKAYRFSISWPRILPKGRGKVSQKGIDFYSKLVDGLLAAGITPYATLYHWDMPQALEDEGGWTVRSTAEAFVEYADVISKALGDRVKNWMTFNEPACSAWLGYDTGEHAPGQKNLPKAIRASHHILLAHGWSVPVLRRNSEGAEVGIVLNCNWEVPASNSVADRELTRKGEGKWVRWFADAVYGHGYPSDVIADFMGEGALPNGMDFVQPNDMATISASLDFLGINYYNRSVKRADVPNNDPQLVQSTPKTPENWTEMNWEVYPQGLANVISRYYYHYQPLKIYVTENGASYSTPPNENGEVHDELRIKYYREHLAAAHKTIEMGIPFAGYFAWSLMDNFEWAKGYAQRFGIVWVDFETQQRIIKDSGKWYKNIIKKNGF